MNRVELAGLCAIAFGPLLVIACGTDDGGEHASDPTRADADAAPDVNQIHIGDGGTPPSTGGVEQLAAEYCQFAERCRERLYRTYWTSVGECTASYRAVLATTAARPGAKAVAEQMSACAAKAKSATCDVSLDQTPECNYRGEAADGTHCREAAQCASGACKQTDAQSPCGVCVDPVGVGGDCIKANCAAGLAYQLSADHTQCSCVAPANVGEPCSPRTCVGNNVCADGICKRPLQLGEACVSSTDLCDNDRDYYCKAGVCTQRVRATLGESCDALNLCAASACINGICVALSVEGRSCGSSATAFCDFELECGRSDQDAGLSCLARTPSACSE